MITVMAMATSTSRATSEIPPAGGLKRIALLVALATVSVVMLRDSLAFIVRPIDPALALRINPANSEVAASRAEQILREDPANRAIAERLARRALERSPVSAEGARMLATARDLTGDAAGARRLIAYSESLSRRDLPTQLWLIEDAVRHNDVLRALHHYDIALRSSDLTKALLFPVLIKAIAQPAVADGLVDILAARPLWADAFLETASRQAEDMDGLARLLTGLARRGLPIPAPVAAQAGARMVDAGHYAAAWQIYAMAHPGAVPGAVRDPDFQQIGDSGGPFLWTSIGASGLLAEPRRYGVHDALAYTAATGSGGVVARQLLLLPAGKAKLAGHSYGQGAGSPPAQLRLTCAGSGRPIGSVAATGDAFAGDFAIPADCPAQWLELFIEGGDNPLGASGAIGGLHVLPVRDDVR